MHSVSKISVTNFKLIQSAEFDFGPYTPLVGYNNAGKSNILRALQWAIEYPSLSRESFFDPESPVVVEANITGVDGEVLDGLAENHRTKIEPYIYDSVLRIRRTQHEPGIAKTQIRHEVLKQTDGEEEWILAPTGIPQALTALFPEVIFVGAMEDSAEDVAKNASGTTIGKLMKAIIDPIRQDYEQQVTDALEPIQRKLSADSVDKDQRLLDVDEEIQRHLQNFFPDVVARTHISMPDFDDVSKRATLKVFENRYGDDQESEASSMGHGAQRSIQISLISALSKIRRANAENAARTVLLLVDEPELYLHPQAIAVARSAFKNLASDGYQVAFTTHSGELVGYEDAANTLIIRRTREEGTSAAPRLMEKISETIEEGARQAELLFELSNSREFLFCDKALLVEGDTEKFLVPRLYEYHFEKTLIEDRIGLVPVNGSTNLPACKAILEAMGIEVRCIADLDFLLKEGTKHGLVGVEDPRRKGLLGICTVMEAEGKISIGDDGWPEKGQGLKAWQGFELLAEEDGAQELISDLTADALVAGYWVWHLGAFEKHLGMTTKGPSAWIAIANKLALGEVAEIPDIDGCKAAIGF
ncbi:MAG: AAA family ATPase [Octadecabacter sp.]|nr:AAA family ATPase [Octadecabacter sp.]